MASEQLQQVLGMFKEMGEKMATAKDMNEMRAMMIEAPAPAGVSCTPVEAGGVSAEWHAAEGADANKVILYVHGGGYVMGSAGSHRDMTSRLSQAAGARVLSLNYRLAPEHPFPAPVDDAVAAYGWLLDQGISPANIAVAGDSAGGGLAIATLLAIRDAGKPLPAAGVGISPWVDMEGTGESMTTRAAADPVVQKEGLLGMAKLYLGDADPQNPLAAPSARQPGRPAAAADSGRRRRDPAERFHAVCRTGAQIGRGRDPQGVGRNAARVAHVCRGPARGAAGD